MDLQATYRDNRATFLYAQIVATAVLGFATLLMLLLGIVKDYVNGFVGVVLFVVLACSVGLAVGVSTVELDSSGLLNGPGTLCAPCPESKLVVTQRTADCPVCPPQPPLVCVLQKLNDPAPASSAAQPTITAPPAAK